MTTLPLWRPALSPPVIGRRRSTAGAWAAVHRSPSW